MAIDPLVAQAGIQGGSVAAAILITAIADAVAEGDYEKARKLREQAVKEFGPEILPQLEKVEAQTIGKSEFADLRADPALVARQMGALDKLAAFTEPGMTPEDVAEQRSAIEAQSGLMAQQQANAEALSARRGMMRSGLSQALGQDAAESGAQRSADVAAQMAAQRQQRRLAALSQFGGMASGIRGQAFEEGSTRASAIDALNRFNANMQYDAQKARNDAALAKYEAELKLKQLRNKAREGVATAFEGRGGRTSATGKNIAGGVLALGETGGVAAEKGLFSK